MDINSAASSSSSSSSSLDNCSSPQQSEWLKETISDSNNRMRNMMTLLEDHENPSARTENYDKWKLELFQMLQEFNGSYCILAKKYDRLRSKLCSGSIPSSSDTNDKTRSVGSPNDPKLELSISCLDSILHDLNVGSDNTSITLEDLKNPMKKLMPPETCNMKMKNGMKEYYSNEKDRDSCMKKGTETMISDDNLVQEQVTAEDHLEDECGSTWSELNFQVTKLMEENLRQQAELAKRNIKKKVIIDRLQSELEHLKHENNELQSCISRLKGSDKDQQFQMPSLRRIFSGKFFDRGCP